MVHTRLIQQMNCVSMQKRQTIIESAISTKLLQYYACRSSYLSYLEEVNAINIFIGHKLSCSSMLTVFVAVVQRPKHDDLNCSISVYISV